MFVYEGRTSSILSATSSANAYTTFNPVVSRSFSESRFGGFTAMNDEYFSLFLSKSSADDLLALSSPAAISRMTVEEKQYLQLLSLSQLGGTYQHTQFTPCRAPAVVINRSGSTDTAGTNWLMPTDAKDHYEFFFNTTPSTDSFMTSETPEFPTRVRL